MHGTAVVCLGSAAPAKQALAVPQIVYYDGQFNDARLAVVLACTAALAGATVLNHTEAVRLLKVRFGGQAGVNLVNKCCLEMHD